MLNKIAILMVATVAAQDETIQPEPLLEPIPGDNEIVDPTKVPEFDGEFDLTSIAEQFDQDLLEDLESGDIGKFNQTLLDPKDFPWGLDLNDFPWGIPLDKLPKDFDILSFDPQNFDPATLPIEAILENIDPKILRENLGLPVYKDLDRWGNYSRNISNENQSGPNGNDPYYYTDYDLPFDSFYNMNNGTQNFTAKGDDWYYTQSQTYGEKGSIISQMEYIFNNMFHYAFTAMNQAIDSKEMTCRTNTECKDSGFMTQCCSKVVMYDPASMTKSVDFRCINRGVAQANIDVVIDQFQFELRCMDSSSVALMSGSATLAVLAITTLF